MTTLLLQNRPALLSLLIGLCILPSCKDTPTVAVDTHDVTLAPPPTGQGIQVVIGPFDVPNGQEVQKNFYQKLPIDTEIYVTKIEFRFNAGSHHLNIFKSDSIAVEDHIEDTFNAMQWENWDMVAASQNADYTWALPPGVAIRLDAHQQMDFQTHFVNAGTQTTPTGRGKAIINFWTTDKKNVTSLVGAVFANNKAVNIPPHMSATFCKTVKAFDHDVQLLLVTGHFHSRGKTFTVGHWDGTKLTDTIYSNTTWAEPPVFQYNPTYTIKAGDSLAFITTYENRTDQAIKFGPHVENEEHSNLFLFYYPGPLNSKALYDFTGGFLMESHPL